MNLESEDENSWPQENCQHPSVQELHHKHLLDNEMSHKVTQLSSVIMGAQKNINSLSMKLHDYKEEQSSQRDRIQRLREDLDICLHQLGLEKEKDEPTIRYKEKYHRDYPLEPLASSTPYSVKKKAVEHVYDEEKLTASQLTDTIIEIKSLLQQLCETLPSLSIEGKLIPISSHHLSSEISLSVLNEKNKELQDKEKLIEALKKKARRIIRQWKEKCISHEEKMEKRIVELQRAQTETELLKEKCDILEEDFHQSQLEVCRLKQEKEIIQVSKNELNLLKSQVRNSQQRLLEMEEKLQKEREIHETKVQKLGDELHHIQAEINTMREELQKQRHQESLLNERLKKMMKENAALQSALEDLKAELTSEVHEKQEQSRRIQEAHANMEKMREQQLYHQNNYKALLHYFHSEINLMAGILSSDNPENFPSLSSPKLAVSEPNQILADIQSKMAWSVERIKNVMQKQENYRKKNAWNSDSVRTE